MERSEKFLVGLKAIMTARGLKDAPLAERAGLGTSFIRDLHRKKASSPKLENALRIADALGLTVEDIISAADGLPTTKSITIAGKVGAGAQVPVFDAYEKGDGPQVEAPPGLPTSGIVAVEVEGDSMEPVFSAGDLLFYTRNSHEGVPIEAIGKRCVCEDENGMGWVKLLRAGRDEGTFDLQSFNDNSPTMYGIRLEWAAPVRLHWPADLVRKV
ncbi:helix-turn-helix domain-containing protein [Mameliella alba]|nr:helix-turn-helix domain-containing protein [Antarctobacter heliothermus]MBY6143333.1 helix-turn-helix domain-containing protein [Mameliella alba]MBY6163994.1 helix-turn-helix domain-containing protein [Mameliella alba]MBY6172466.1 helix-turn-helix domain-containing protein [Mameliella alba]MBY6177480.1 helix-turn-helix domain-containing protein [Mameliella alba]